MELTIKEELSTFFGIYRVNPISIHNRKIIIPNQKIYIYKGSTNKVGN